MKGMDLRFEFTLEMKASGTYRDEGSFVPTLNMGKEREEKKG